MTGFGYGEAEGHGWRVEIELRSVNHRFLDVKVRGHCPLGAEERITERLRAAIERGAIAVTLRVRQAAGNSLIQVDKDVARAVYQELSRLAKELGDAKVTLELVCAQPGVIVSREPVSGDDSLIEVVESATDRAVAALREMRGREGEALSRELDKRIDRVEVLGQEIGAFAQETPREVAQRMQERVERLVGALPTPVDEQRLAQEIAILSDRLDITEELVRLEAHLGQWRQISQSTASSCGRKMSFLLQEFGREINTIGSKSQSSEVSRRVVEVKAELEKLREQVQNVE